MVPIIKARNKRDNVMEKESSSIWMGEYMMAIGRTTGCMDKAHSSMPITKLLTMDNG